jgi:hypothetical protein
MKLPYIFIFDLDVIIGDTYFNRFEYNLLNIIHKQCKIDNILNKCIDKYDLTEELENGLLRPNFKDFIEFIRNKFKTVEFYIYSSNHNNKWVNSGIITDIEKIANIKFNKPYLIQIPSFVEILILITTDIISKYPSFKIQKNKDIVFQNQLLFFNSRNNEDYSKLQIIPPQKYNYYQYYSIFDKFINKYEFKEEVFDNKEILDYFEENKIPIYNKNGSKYQQDLQCQVILDLHKRRLNEINIKDIKDTYFNDLMILLKKKRTLNFDDKTIRKINDKFIKII